MRLIRHISLGGLLFKPGGSNMQHATSLSFLLIVYARYMRDAKKEVHCDNIVANPDMLIKVAKGQVCNHINIMIKQSMIQ